MRLGSRLADAEQRTIAAGFRHERVAASANRIAEDALAVEAGANHHGVVDTRTAQSVLPFLAGFPVFKNE